MVKVVAKEQSWRILFQLYITILTKPELSHFSLRLGDKFSAALSPISTVPIFQTDNTSKNFFT